MVLNMLTQFILLSLFSASLSVLADSNKTLTIYHDTDYSVNKVSAKAMKMGGYLPRLMKLIMRYKDLILSLKRKIIEETLSVAY